MKKNRKNKEYNPNNCPITHCMNKIGGKWKPLVIYLIKIGKVRFSTLKQAIPGISKQMLVNQLHELEQDKIIERIVYAERPPRVEYKLTAYGYSLKPVIAAMAEWGKEDMVNPIVCIGNTQEQNGKTPPRPMPQLIINPNN